MSAIIGYGITKLLDYDASFNIKADFLKSFFKLGYNDGFYEIIDARNEAGDVIADARLFTLFGNNINERPIPFNIPDTNRINAWRNERQSIDYDMWDKLDSVQVFVPNAYKEEPWTIDMQPIGRVKFAPALYGLEIARNMMEIRKGVNKDLWKGVYEMFCGAFDHNLILIITH
ncbi:hypothetical protein CJD36_004755 [Flavipsychrobacter stenotrophus]|uniref:Uncharacterized protein n=1 Tax=Flavipsychrobacter stenotrophus TaxID=2077091 RepID=A0A2S7T2I7_9BACT|nr:hypothetical protein [Flavipsychrobacter stenotrophus]PQJ13057.1 hypothetical protein CJD36_004755 [Flavipsychrobacter stenotrophus]